MAKILLLVLAAVAALLLIRGFGRKRPRSGTTEPVSDEAMVRCGHCGLHLPRTEALASGERHYCSESHRAEAERNL